MTMSTEPGRALATDATGDTTSHAVRYRFLVRRLAWGLVTLFCVSVLVFAATQILPGDPARAILGQGASAERVAQLNEQLGVDEPPLVQYGNWIGGVVTGDLGESVASGRPVTETIGPRIVNSSVLVLFAGLIALPLGASVGVLAASRRGRPSDESLSMGSLVLASMPEFVIGLLLTTVFATTVFHVLPAVAVIPPGESVFSNPQALILPVMTLVAAVVPYLFRMARASSIDVLESDYVTMARLKGLSERRVLWRHAVPNALVPLIQVSALELAWMAGGIVVVEFLFGYPGIGSALTQAVGQRDVPLIQAIVLFLASIYVVLNLIADLLTILVTPRLRTAVA